MSRHYWVFVLSFLGGVACFGCCYSDCIGQTETLTHPSHLDTIGRIDNTFIAWKDFEDVEREIALSSDEFTNLHGPRQTGRFVSIMRLGRG